MTDDHEQMPLRFVPRSATKTAARGRKRASPSRAVGEIARLKVTLRDIRPPIWRRLEVPTAISLGALHHILQIAFGWTDSHLHDFQIGNQWFGTSDDEFSETADENKARLDQLLPMLDEFIYQYDFGDSWMHLVVLERLRDRESGAFYPRCTGGKRAGPPEDCGGVSGYEELLAALNDPGHEEHQSMMEWSGGFDSERFDIEEINRRLKGLSAKRRWVRS